MPAAPPNVHAAARAALARSIRNTAGADIAVSVSGPLLAPAVDAAYAAGRDAGYVCGLSAAARWVRTFDQALPGFDRDTCRKMARGLTVMVASAIQRLGAA